MYSATERKCLCLVPQSRLPLIRMHMKFNNEVEGIS